MFLLNYRSSHIITYLDDGWTMAGRWLDDGWTMAGRWLICGLFGKKDGEFHPFFNPQLSAIKKNSPSIINKKNESYACICCLSQHIFSTNLVVLFFMLMLVKSSQKIPELQEVQKTLAKLQESTQSREENLTKLITEHEKIQQNIQLLKTDNEQKKKIVQLLAFIEKET